MKGYNNLNETELMISKLSCRRKAKWDKVKVDQDTNHNLMLLQMTMIAEMVKSELPKDITQK